MDPNHIHEDITRYLYKVEEQYSHILQQEGHIPMLEMDLLLKDVCTLYECFLDLRAIAEQQRRAALKANPATPAKAETKSADTLFEPISEGISAEAPTDVLADEIPETAADQQIEPAEAPQKNQASKAGQAQPENAPKQANIAWQKTFDASKDKPEGIDKPANKPVSTGGAIAPPVVTSPKVDLLKEREKDFVPTVRKIEFKQEPIQSQETKKESIFDKAASLYDKIAKPADKTIAGQAVKQPISNIKASIGINEKFILLKDLFKNNTDEYNDALEKLNNFDTYSDAEDFFQELKAKYNWDAEGKSFQSLAELLNRRYLHNAWAWQNLCWYQAL